MEANSSKPPQKHFLLYFGCWGQAGHYLFDRNKRSIYDSRAEGLPFNHEALDGSSVFLPNPERRGIGALTHVVRGDDAYTVFAWWGSPFDTRGRVNAAIIASGWDSADELWRRFSIVYEPLAKLLSKPIILP